MKITLNEKLFEAKKNEPVKEPGAEKFTMRVKKDFNSPEKVAAKNLHQLLTKIKEETKSSTIRTIEYIDDSTISFSTFENKSTENYVVGLENSKDGIIFNIEKDGKEIAEDSIKDSSELFDIISYEVKPISNFKESNLENYTNIVKSVVSPQPEKVNSDKDNSEKESKKQAWKDLHKQKEPTTLNNKSLSELPPTPEEGKPLPKEVTNPPEKPEPIKPSITPPSLSRDQISKAFSSIANDQKSKQKPTEPSKEAQKNVNKSVNLDVPKVQKNEPPKAEPTVTPTVKPDVQKVVEPEVKNEPPIEQKPIPEPEIQKPAASAVSDADLSTKPEEQKSSEPVVQTEPSKEDIPAEQPVAEPSSTESPVEEPKVTPKSTFKHPDYKDEISGKDPYSTERAKQNKQKLQTLKDTEFNIVVSKPFSLGKKSQAEDNGELYSRTVNVDEKGNVRYIFSLKFPEANKKLFEAVEKINLQATIAKILNSFKNLKIKEIAITDFQNAEFDGLYIPKNILTSVLITTSKNIAKAPVAQVPLNASDKQISDISLSVTQKISEMISNDVSMEDSITKISFVTTLVKSDRQPEEDLSGDTKVGRKINPPQIPPMKDISTQAQDDPSYKINPNDTGVQKIARQLGVVGGDTVPNNQQAIPESEVYKNKAVFELYNPMVNEGELTTDQISSSPSYKLRDMKYRGLVNNAFYLESSENLVFNLMQNQEKGFNVVVSPDSAFVLQTKNGIKKYFSAEKGYKVLGKNEKKELVPVSDYKKAGQLFYVVLGNLPVIQESNIDPNEPEQEENKEKVFNKTVPSIPQQNQGPATSVGKQKGIQPDTSPISTDPTQVAPIPVQNTTKPNAAPAQNQPVAQNQKLNAIPKLDAILQFKRAVLGHIRENLQKFMEAYPKRSDILSKWLKNSQLISSNQPAEPQKASEPQEPEQKQVKKRGRPPKQQVTEAIKDNKWERPSHQNWRNPDEPLSVRSTNLRKQDYFGPGQNRRLEKDTVMYATKESDIIDGVNDVFKSFTDKSLTKEPNLQPYIEKLQNRKFFPIKVVKLENNLFFVKSDSSDKLFIIAPVGILYERIKEFYQTPASTNESRVLKYTKLASIPLERANISMSIMENHVEKGICAVSATEQRTK